MASLLPVFQKALEQGCIYGIIALALFLTYSMLNVCDLSTDGCFTMGAATGAVVALSGHPFLSLFAAIGVGILSGFVNAFLQTQMKLESMLAGIIVNTGLYTVNIWIMGKANLNMNTTDTVFSMAKDITADTPIAAYSKLILGAFFVILIGFILARFLRTRMGLSIRATGNNIAMVKSSSINPSLMITIGLCIGGAMTALSGCLIGQYQKSVDINMGTGMVTAALASLIIGETIFGRKSVPVRIIGAMLGSLLYRVIVAAALRVNIDANAMKLVSALIVAIAISIPAIKEKLALQATKQAAMRKHRELYGAKEGR